MKRILALLLVLSLLCLPALGDELNGMFDKADAYLAAGDFDSAAICLDIAQKLSPDDPAVLHAFARLHYAAGDTDLALEDIEAALALAPADGTLYLEKACLLYAANCLNDAEQALRYAKVCSVEPDDELLSEAAQAYIRAGQYEKAIELCEAQPNDALRLLTAQACERAGLYERAVEIFETLPAAVWQDEYASVYARALIRSGNIERAQALGLTSLYKKDEVLAAAIQDGSTLRLIPAYETLADSLINMPVFCSAAAADEIRGVFEAAGLTLTPSEDGQRVRISDTLSMLVKILDISAADIQFLSISPSGSALLFELAGNVALVRNQEITVLAVNPNRGAQNEYAEKTYKYIYKGLSSLAEPDCFCWSPDERYVAMTFPNKVLTQMQLMDLLLADTQTGEIFLAEATPKQALQDGALTATTACFDPAGEYVYYLVYGYLPDDARSGLKRCRLETGEVELLAVVPDTLFYYPHLTVDTDGTVRAITDTVHSDESAGVITFTNVAGKWEAEIHSLPNSIQLQRPKRYYRSETSGYELILSSGKASVVNDVYIYTNYLTIRNDTLGTGSHADAIRLPADGSGQAEAVKINEYLTAMAEGTLAQPTIIQVTLSRDGYSALILAAQNGTVICCILDLDTLVCRRVEFPEDTQPSTVDIAQTSATLRWLEDGTILIPVMRNCLPFRLSIE